jgi:hypothetical protein
VLEAKEFVEYMNKQTGPNYDKCLDQLRLLGEAEIRSSSVLEPTPSISLTFKAYHKWLKKQIKPSLIDRGFGYFGNPEDKSYKFETDKKILVAELEQYRNHRDLLSKHFHRLAMMNLVATCLLECGPDKVGYVIVEKIIRERKARLTEHKTVIMQAILGTEILIDNIETTISLIGYYSHTHTFAKKVNASVKRVKNEM